MEGSSPGLRNGFVSILGVTAFFACILQSAPLRAEQGAFLPGAVEDQGEKLVPLWPEDEQGALTKSDHLEFSPSTNDFGNTGLLQMPNARFQRDGAMSLGVSHIDPYTRGFFTLQVLPWLEGTFRYTDIGNRLYSNSRDFSGEQSFKDRSVDLKLLVLEETQHFPQVAIGLRDLGGTDLFGSEFLIFSRRYYNWDFTVGVAWGNAGSKGHVPNPFGFFSDSAKNRGESGGPGGFGFDFFRGDEIAFFGGIEFEAPINGLRLKVEYDGNNYQNEPLGNEFETYLPLNFGIEYEVSPYFRLAAAFERGNQFMLRTSISANLMEDTGVPKLDRPVPEVEPREPNGEMIDGPLAAQEAMLALPEAVDRTLTVERLFDQFEELGLSVSDIELDGREAVLRLPTEASRPRASAVATAALQVARAELDGPVDSVRIVATRDDADLWEIALRTDQLLRSLTLTGSPIALVEPPEPKWLGLFAESEPFGYPFDESESADSEDRLTSIAGQVFAELERQGFRGERFDMEGRRATVQFSQDRYRNPAKAVGRGALAVAAHVPPEVEEISVVLTELGVAITKTTVMRRDLERALQHRGSTEEIWHNALLEAPPLRDSNRGVANEDRYPELTWSFMPQMRQQIGGPDEFYLFQLYARADAQLQISQGLSVSGALGKNIYDTFDQLDLESDSKLPHVRSDIREYLREGDFWIDSLHLDYITKISPEVYGRASAGIFELMFAGIGGEVLYRPVGKRWATGLDVNYARQRDFDGLFSLQDYDVFTGHISYYHRLPWWEVLATIRAGRYLAKDWGGTLELSRTFDSGVTFGVFATKTEVSATEFGEGDFDKGFFVSIPLELFFTQHSRKRSGLVFRPLTRDGGQQLILPKPLYPLTSGADAREIGRGWEEMLD